MAVSVTFSRISGGSAISDTLQGSSSGLNHGNVANGKDTVTKDIYIKHDGTNEITNCKFYFGQFSGTYGGGQTAALDWDELLSWGDTSSEKGILVDINHDDIYEYNLKTGQMDSGDNAVSLDDSSAGGTNPDDIGVGGEAHIKIKVSVPSTETIAGIRQTDFFMKYSYTS